MENKNAFCSNCGAPTAPDAVFCTECGSNLKEQQPKSAEQAPVAQEVPVSCEAEPVKAEREPISKKNSIMSMVFGIVALGFAFSSYSAIACFIFIPAAIVFLALGFKKRNAFVEEAGRDNAFSKIGKITSIISIPVTAVCGVIGFVCSILAMAGGEEYFDLMTEAFEGILDIFDY